VSRAAEIPTIDVTALRRRAPDSLETEPVDPEPFDPEPFDPEPFDPDPARLAVGERLVSACEGPGVFRVVGHGIDTTLRSDLEHSARSFFALAEDEKARIAMARSGLAWRGWFPLGGELTSGVPDAKEGLYFGTDLPPDDPRVVAGVPLHGPNPWPDRPAELRQLVTRWMDEVTALGRSVLSGIALGMGVDEDLFDTWCADPTVLFRIFRYPARTASDGDGAWGVGEHTDYGLLTLLAQDGTGGLQVRIGSSWVHVDPDPVAIVCNLGDMLERLSGGRFVATPHRVAPPTTDRISMPLFLDPGWDVHVGELPRAGENRRKDLTTRWDGEDVHLVDGPYSDYLLSRVARVFPDLFASTGVATTDPTAAGTKEGRRG